MYDLISQKTAKTVMPLVAVASVLVILSLSMSSSAYGVTPTFGASFANSGSVASPLTAANVVTAPVSLSASPHSVTIKPGGIATYILTAHNSGKSTFTIKGCVFTINGQKGTCSATGSIPAGKTVKATLKLTTTTKIPAGTYNLKEYLTGTYGTTSANSATASFVLVVS